VVLDVNRPGRFELGDIPKDRSFSLRALIVYLLLEMVNKPRFIITYNVEPIIT
jgi:hypothetical protein